MDNFVRPKNPEMNVNISIPVYGIGHYYIPKKLVNNIKKDIEQKLKNHYGDKFKVNIVYENQ